MYILIYVMHESEMEKIFKWKRIQWWRTLYGCQGIRMNRKKINKSTTRFVLHHQKRGVKFKGCMGGYYEWALMENCSHA